MEYVCVFEYTCTLHLFSQIYSNLPFYKMKWNSFFSNLLPRLYSNICAKKLWNFFKRLRWDTLKHAYPWKVVLCDTWKGVTVMCFHPLSTPFNKQFENIKRNAGWSLWHVWNQACCHKNVLKRNYNMKMLNM